MTLSENWGMTNWWSIMLVYSGLDRSSWTKMNWCVLANDFMGGNWGDCLWTNKVVLIEVGNNLWTTVQLGVNTMVTFWGFWHFCLPTIELEKDNERKRGGEEDEQDREEWVNEKKKWEGNFYFKWSKNTIIIFTFLLDLGHLKFEKILVTMTFLLFQLTNSINKSEWRVVHRLFKPRGWKIIVSTKFGWR